MEKTVQKVARLEVVSSREKVDNSVATDRRYNIMAEVSIRGKEAESIDNGRVTRLDTGADVASFNTWGERGMNANFNDADIDEIPTLAADIAAFVKDVKAVAAE